jgi:hypothetical protein
VSRAVAALRLLRIVLRARAITAHALGRTEAEQALWSVHDDVEALIALLMKERRR